MAGSIKPLKLNAGSTIAIIAPARPPVEARLRKGISFLKARGYKIMVFPHVRQRLGYLAGEDSARAEAVNSAFADPKVDAVFCARGGYGSLRIMKQINYDIIRLNPKIFA